MNYVWSIDCNNVKEFESDTIEDCIQWCQDKIEEIDSYGTPRTWDQMGSINFYNQEIERLTQLAKQDNTITIQEE